MYLWMNRLLVLAALLFLIPCFGCSRLAETMLDVPQPVDAMSVDGGPSPWNGELEKPELQPVDQYPLDVAEATVVMEDNEIYGNNKAGISIRGSQPVHVRGCRLYNNGTSGIRAFAHSRIYMDNTSVYANRTGGIEMKEGELLHVRKASIYGNGEGGVRVKAGETRAGLVTSVDIRDSRIFLNSQGGISIKSPAPVHTTAIIARNAVFRNGKSGVRIEDDVWMTAWDNVLIDNATGGISAVAPGGKLPVMDIFQNRICFNEGAGIFVQAGRTGRYGISNNWIYNNFRVGIGCGLEDVSWRDKSRIAIFHNTIVANGAGAIGAGIRDDSGGVVVVRNNIIAWNARTGMMIGNCHDATHNLLYANGETSDFDENDENAYLFERLQYAGCPTRGWGDIIEDPQFLSPDQYDFSLRESSPAQDAGEEIDTPYFRQFGRTDMGSLYVPPTLFETGFYRNGGR